MVLIGLSADFPTLIVAEIGLAMTGLGMGFATGPLMGAAVDSVLSARSGTAAALINVARMVGATIGVAVLGSIFSVSGGGPGGLRIAMIAGACVQLAGAAVAWAAIRSTPDKQRTRYVAPVAP